VDVMMLKLSNNLAKPLEMAGSSAASICCSGSPLFPLLTLPICIVVAF